MQHSLCKARISKMDCQKWKFFEFKKIFDIRKGKRLTKADMVNGDIPYIGATDSNNGVTARISNDEYLHSANTISVSYNGSIAEAFYQTKDFWATDDVNVLYPKFELNKEIALFLTTIINREKYRFNYGRKWDKESMELSRIKLPAIKATNGEYEPDWTWIENYIKNDLVKKLPKKAKDVWQKKFNPKPLSQKKLTLNTNDWKWFTLDDDSESSFFKIDAGKYHYSSEYSEGKTPYLSATAINNGVGSYIDLEPEFEGNVMTTEKVHCTSFYQKNVFCATSDVNIIQCKKDVLNVYVGMFIISIIDFNENFRWNYGRQCRVNDTKSIRIKLPAIKIAPNEYEPDWQFMEDYIKSLPYSSCL